MIIDNKCSLPQIVVAQLGARMHYAVPLMLHQAGLLEKCYTDVYVGLGNIWDLLYRLVSLTPPAMRAASFNRLLDRHANGLPPDKITAFNLFGLQYSLALSRVKSIVEQQRIYLKFGDRFGDLILNHLAHKPHGFYIFQGSAFPLFQVKDCLKIFERFIAPKYIEWQLISEENERWPGWEEPYPPLEVFQSILEREEAEWSLADVILCPSEFVVEGMIAMGATPEKLFLVPYGLDVNVFTCAREPWDGRRPLRLLFLGAVTLRKGVQYIFEALQLLKGASIEARMVGPMAIRESFGAKLAGVAEIIGPVPRSEVLKQYAWADVFIFPSLCEGSATVTYEALAAGLPIITTPNAGSVVRDGHDGFIIPIRDPDALAEKIELLLGNSELLAHLSHNAKERAQEYSLEKYAERLVGCIKSCIKDKGIT